MYPRSVGSQQILPFAFPRFRGGLLVLLIGAVGGLLLAVSIVGVSRHAEHSAASGPPPPADEAVVPARQTPTQPPRAAVAALHGGERAATSDTLRIQPFRAFESAGLGIAGAVQPVWGTAWGRSMPAASAAPPSAIEPPRNGADPADERGLRWVSGNPAGSAPIVVTSWADGFVPHGWVAIQKDLERHFLQIGGPWNDGQAPRDRFAGDQPIRVLSAARDPAPARDGTLPLGAGFSLLGLNGGDAPDASRAATPARFMPAVTPTIQYFPVEGPTDGARYFWPDVQPNNTGVRAGLAYAPWDRPAADLPFVNLSFTARYAANKEFSGAVRGAGGGNTLVLSLWGALHF